MTERTRRSPSLAGLAAAVASTATATAEEGGELARAPAGDATLTMAQKEMVQRLCDKVPQPLIDGLGSKSVEEIEEWLRNTKETISNNGMTIINNSPTNMEGSYLSKHMPKIFYERNPLISDIEMIDDEFNSKYNIFFNGITNNKIASICKKFNTFLPSEQSSENSDCTSVFEGASILNKAVSPFMKTQAVTNVLEVITPVNDDIKNIQVQKEVQKFSNDQQLTCTNGVTKNSCNINFDASLRNVIDSSFEFTNRNINNSTYLKSFDDKNKNNSTDRSKNTIPSQFSIQIKPKIYNLRSNNNNSTRSNSVSTKTKLKTRIVNPKKSIKCTKKLLNGKDTYCSDNNNLSTVNISKKIFNIVPSFIVNSENDPIPKNGTSRYNKMNKKKSPSNYKSSMEEQNFSYQTQQVEIISKELAKKGITERNLQHFRLKNNRKVWKCHLHECGRHYVKLIHLKAHLLTHYGIKPFKCSYSGCSWAFNTELRLKRHKETHLNKKDYVCSKAGCERRFSTAHNLSNHEKLHERPTRSCPVFDCNGKFATRQALEAHMRSHGRDLAPYTCNHEGCGKPYYSFSAYMSHQRIHCKSHACTWTGCGKIFEHFSKLKVHMNFHTGSKPFACPFQGCQWAFATASKLSRHKRRHTNDRKFICDMPNCKKTYTRSEHLSQHKLAHTVNSFKYKYICDICDSRFSIKVNLRTHMKEHLGNDCKSWAKKKNEIKNEVRRNNEQVLFSPKVPPIKISTKGLKLEILTNESCQLQKSTTEFNQENESFVGKKKNQIADKVHSSRLLLQKEQIVPLSEIQNTSSTHSFTSSPFPQEDFSIYDSINYSMNKSNDQTTSFVYHDVHVVESDVQEYISLPIDIRELSEKFQDTENSLNELMENEELVQINEGSARTTFTWYDILRLKLNKDMVALDFKGNDVVLDVPNLEDHFSSNDFSSVYCQENFKNVPKHTMVFTNESSVDFTPL